VEVLPDGWKLWLQWKKARAKAEGKNPSLVSDIKSWKPTGAVHGLYQDGSVQEVISGRPKKR